MAITGGFAKLHEFQVKVQSLAQEDARAQLADNLAEEAIDLYIDGFREETNPYGQRWQRKVFNDGRKVLSGQTGQLKRVFRMRVDAKGFRIATNADHAKYTLGTGLWGPRKRRIYPVHAKCLAFFAHGYVAINTRKKWAAGLDSSTSVKSAKASFRKNVSGAQGSMQFRASVAGSVPRLIFPQKKRGLPKAHAEAFRETAELFLLHHLSSKSGKIRGSRIKG